VIAVEPEPIAIRTRSSVLPPDAPDVVVRGAFRELVKEAHADQGGNDAYDVSERVEAGTKRAARRVVAGVSLYRSSWTHTRSDADSRRSVVEAWRHKEKPQESAREGRWLASVW